MKRGIGFAVMVALGTLGTWGCGDDGNPASCTDGAQNQDETDIDCGGSCGGCAIGDGCLAPTDCASGFCGTTGVCVECGVASDCAGTWDECRTPTCTAGACDSVFTAAGTALPAADQTAGDCRVRQCNGTGGIESANDDEDVPIDDDPCTDDVCTAGVPSNPDSAAGTSCGTDLVCDGAGACVGCVAPDDCPGTDTECRYRSCTAGTCGMTNAAAGTALAAQTAGDCQEVQCDGAGGTTSANLDTDLPDDGNPCTGDVCTAGVPSNPNAAAGTTCGTDLVCDGAGHCTGCVAAGDCPGTDDECGVRTCTAGVCGRTFTAAGTPLTAQTAGDCQVVQCDGAGDTESVAADTDLPVDGSDCTQDVCTAGVPSNPNETAGTTCATGVCDGAGACVSCILATDCSGTDDECGVRTCTAGVCGRTFTTAGTPLTAQTPGDCQVVQCDGAGGTTSVAADTDLPVDGNDCTQDVCTAGVASNPAEPAGTTCAAGQCNGAGTCVGCLVAGDCSGVDDECGVRTCTAGVCGRTFTPAGTPLTTQTAGDCQVVQCNGAGGTTSVAADTDLPVDGLECTSDVCTAGVPSNPAVADGTSCTSGGGQFCYAGVCEISFVVLRVGDGSAALTNASTAVFLERHVLSGGLLGTAALPIAAAGTNQPLTLAGNATSEGELSLSADGHYVVLGGYAAAPGTTGIAATTAAATNRIVGRIDAALAIDTSTRLDAAFSGSNIRGATTFDGTTFWATGTSSGSPNSGGAWTIALGATGGTQILATPNNSRWCGIFADQLYGSAGSVPFVNVFSIGTGMPTTAGQTATSLAGMPTTSGPSSYGFVLFDRNPAVAGVDTLYVADDRSVATGGGVQKWTFDGTTWTLVATFNTGLTSGVRGLAGLVTGANVTLLATTSQSLPNTVVQFIDDGSATPAATVVATVITNAVYRGVAFSPR
jgi:hypothetical protein